MILCTVFFFFKQKTAYEMRISDWSSDVCSSDLNPRGCAHPRNGLRCDHSCYRRRPNGARQANQEIRKRDRGLSHRTDHVSAVPRVRRRPDRSPKYDPSTTDLAKAGMDGGSSSLRYIASYLDRQLAERLQRSEERRGGKEGVGTGR